MIPQEKIQQEINRTNPCTRGEKLAYANGFRIGVQFAETELKQIALEFAEWCVKLYKPVYKFGLVDYWYLNLTKEIKYTTSELFDKFIAERQV